MNANCLGPTAEKERQKAEKAKRFAEKQAKKQAGVATTTKAATALKDADALPKYVEQTPYGEKKGWLRQSSLLWACC